jgi:hypothetical protein
MSKRGSMVLAVALGLIGVITVIAQGTAGPPQPSPEHKKLAVFVGTWKDEAETKPSPFGPGEKFTMMETCEWLAGGFSVVCHSEVTGLMGQKSLTVLTYDPEEKVYTLYEFNSLGQSGSAKGTVEGDIWTWNGESKMGGKRIKSRDTIKLPSPNSATMTSEISVDGGPWTAVMELKGSRVK